MPSEHLRSHVEHQIRAAIAEGAFEDLPGKGKPLEFEEHAHIQAGLRLAFHVLRNAGISPAWLEKQKDLRAEIEQFRADLQRAVTHPRRPLERHTCQRLRTECEAINRAIRSANLEVPLVSLQLHGLDFEREVAAAETRAEKKKDQL